MSRYFLVGENVHCYDDDSMPLPHGVREITEAEAMELRLPLPDRIAQKCAELAACYSEAIGADIEITTVGGVTKFFQAGEDSRQKIHDALVGTEMDGETPPGFFWKSADNTLVAPFTRTDLMALSRAIFLRGASAFVKVNQLKSQAQSAQCSSDLTSITW